MTTTVVTGASSGIGAAIAIYLAQQGHHVVGTVRSLDKAGKLLAQADTAGVLVHLAELDVTDDDSVSRGFASIVAEHGAVDVLVNNAGVGGNGVVEETTTQTMNDVLNVNVNGPLRCVRAVLPGMRTQGSGTIVNISSITGRFGAPAQAPYVASKWALEGLSESLALEVAGFGVRVAIVEPGVTKSSIFRKNVAAPNLSAAYDAVYRRMFQMYAVGMANASDAIEVAQVVHHAITTDTPQLRYLVSWGAAELAAGRATMSDGDWFRLGAHVDDDQYYEQFLDQFGLDIRPEPTT